MRKVEDRRGHCQHLACSCSCLALLPGLCDASRSAGLAIELRHELGLARLETDEDGSPEGGKLGKPMSMPAGSAAAAAAAGLTVGRARSCCMP